MKVKGLVPFRTKILNPCRSFFSIFKFKLKKPLIIRALFRPRPPRTTKRKAPPRRNQITRLLQLICSAKMPKELDQLGELQSTSTVERERLLHPSSITPAYTKKAAKKKKVSRLNIVEDACRSFENYLMEMIIEEGKVSDLNDVEELLYCSTNLKSPVFIELVCRFYGELCKDLFAPDDESNHTGK